MNSTDTMQQVPVAARSPRGCNRSVMTMVTDREHHKLEGIAELEMRSLSSTARMLLLLGIERYEADTEQAARC
ncbi:hypothetical protein TW86_10560 [Halomonas sp. S2151]|uniref:hypothetical protein n=1 Tax=Halomonas sp. S2151 TaxID=579478 RepID=UPI0005F9FA56|nr:hypothetical protein [Halomonas sp. S2151]KJZ14022.1 hypothetical protein TW86_10560 [Halomonas sp. S2151]